MFRFMLYILRWEASTLVLYPIIKYLPCSTLIKTIVANLVGGCIFFSIDKLIFNKKLEVNKK